MIKGNPCTVESILAQISTLLLKGVPSICTFAALSIVGKLSIHRQRLRSAQHICGWFAMASINWERSFGQCTRPQPMKCLYISLSKTEFEATLQYRKCRL